MKKFAQILFAITICIALYACNANKSTPQSASSAPKANSQSSPKEHIVAFSPILVAGNASKGSDNGNIVTASFNEPCAVLPVGNIVYVADTGNNLIRQINESTVSTLAGVMTGYDIYNTAIDGYNDANNNKALFAKPTALLSTNGGMLVLDSGNNAIRLINAGKVSTFAGQHKAGHKNGTCSKASFNNPQGFCADQDGNIYIADTGNNLIRKISTDCIVSTYAGGLDCGFKDGCCAEALFNSPMGVAFYNDTLYITDSANNRIRAIKDGMVSTIAGCGTEKYEGTEEYMGDYKDGKAETACFDMPTGIAAGPSGALYIADTNNNVIRLIKDGTVHTVKGFAEQDNNILNIISPRGVCYKSGMLYITDSFKNTVLKITPSI
ncbi:MAG: hypothetical protein RSE10_08850 [Oscillospiraceae bacterium]